MAKIIHDKDKKKYESSIPIAVDLNTKKKLYLTFDKEAPELKSIEGAFRPIPYLDLSHNQRSMTMVSAPSGAGKSRVTRAIIESLRKDVYKDNKRQIYLFTKRCVSDPAYENLRNITQIGIEEFAPFPTLTSDDLRDSICVFDDIETVQPKQLNDATLHLIQDLAETSRKKNISIVCIFHQTQQSHKTKPAIFESDTYYLSPSASRNSVKKFLDSYGDVSPSEMKEMLQYSNLPFEFLTLRKSVPRFWMSPRKIQILE